LPRSVNASGLRLSAFTHSFSLFYRWTSWA
jgi:hypothetical protein